MYVGSCKIKKSLFVVVEVTAEAELCDFTEPSSGKMTFELEILEVDSEAVEDKLEAPFLARNAYKSRMFERFSMSYVHFGTI